MLFYIKALLLVGEFLVNGADLLLHVDVVHMAKLRLTLGIHSSVVTVNSRLLSPRTLIFRNRLASNRVKNVLTLAGQTLEVVGNIDRVHVG